MAKLTGKCAVITGGAGGIGAAAARLFIAEGAKVLLVDLDEATLKRTAQDTGALWCAADVTDAAATRRYVADAAQRLGGIDIALLNAGIEGVVKPIVETPPEVFDKVMAVNVRGVFLGLAAVIPEMKRRGGGSIVITSSIAGVRGGPGVAPYIASKHAVIGLMRTAALEGAPDKIRVNTVNPAPIETRMIESLEKQRYPDDPQKARDGWLARIPARRYGTPEEVAKLMLFLASDDSSYCSGGTYMIDGAMTA
jgi:NAD(P)-dependent dehydrogenase (short-subunit alcohol dehydrogenase family)